MPDVPGDLEARLALLEDERAVLGTLYGYAHAIDFGHEEAWVDLFTEDADYISRSAVAHGPETHFQGRDELRAFIAKHTRAPERLHKHMIVEPVIEVNGATATAASYLFVLMEHDGEPVIRVMGRYVDRLEKGGDGRWRFAERVAEVDAFKQGLPALYGGRPG